MTARAILYLRLSVERGTSTSISRQRDDLLDLARREGWDVVAEFNDEGLSGGKDRENAARALRMLRDGDADVLAVWKFDRWSRQGLGAVAKLVETLDHREKLAEAGRAAPALFVALADGLRSDQPAWRIIASVLAEVARQERENTRTRTRSSIARLKRDGMFSGGTVPLGYRTAPHTDGVHRMLIPDETEARYLREAAERIVAGASPYSVSVWLNGSPLRPRRAATWSVQALVQALTGTAIVGRVSVGGDVRRDSEGLPLQVWEPAIPLALWHAVRGAIEERRVSAPKVGVRRAGRRSRLLSGVLVCGECGRPMYVRQTSTGIPIYSCLARSNGRSTPSVSVTAARIEEYVEAQFLAAAGALPVRRPVERDAPALALVEAQTALTELSAQLGDPDLEDDAESRLLAQRLELRDRIRSLRDLAAASVGEVEFVDSGETTREVWDTMDDDVDARRHLLWGIFESIEVRSGRQGARGLDPARITLHWMPETGVIDSDGESQGPRTK